MCGNECILQSKSVVHFGFRNIAIRYCTWKKIFAFVLDSFHSIPKSVRDGKMLCCRVLFATLWRALLTIHPHVINFQNAIQCGFKWYISKIYNHTGENWILPLVIVVVAVRIVRTKFDIFLEFKLNMFFFGIKTNFIEAIYKIKWINLWLYR